MRVDYNLSGKQLITAGYNQNYATQATYIRSEAQRRTVGRQIGRCDKVS